MMIVSSANEKNLESHVSEQIQGISAKIEILTKNIHYRIIVKLYNQN